MKLQWLKIMKLKILNAFLTQHLLEQESSWWARLCNIKYSKYRTDSYYPSQSYPVLCQCM